MSSFIIIIKGLLSLKKAVDVLQWASKIIDKLQSKYSNGSKMAKLGVILVGAIFVSGAIWYMVPSNNESNCDEAVLQERIRTLEGIVANQKR